MKKFLAGCCAFISLVLFPIVLLSTITIYWVFTPSTIKKIVYASEIGENLPSLIVAMMADKGGGNEEFDIAATAELVGNTFSADDVYGLIDPLVDGIGTWFNTDKPIEQLDLTINISNLKAKLIPAISEQIKASAVEEVDTAAMTDEVTKNIPDTVNVQDLLQEQLVQTGGAGQLALVNQQIDLYRTYWGALHWIVWLGWAVIGLCSLCMALLRLRPGYAPFGWLAWVTLLQLVELVPVTLLVWLAPRFILPWISGSFDSVIVTVLDQASSALLATYLWPLVWVMIGLFVSTIIWFIIRGLVKHHVTHTSQPAAPATTPSK